MKQYISIFNDVLGPVMRGPSSSHTAGSYHIGHLARGLFGEPPTKAIFTFDPKGSYAQVYREQKSDQAFAAAMMGLSITDEHFTQALKLASASGLDIRFIVKSLTEANHPNTVAIHLTATSGRTMNLLAKSIGGGAIIITQIQGWPVHITGDAHEVLVEMASESEMLVQQSLLEQLGEPLCKPLRMEQGNKTMLHFQYYTPIANEIKKKLFKITGINAVWTTVPIFFVKCGTALFTSATEMVKLSTKRNCSLGRLALAYEATLLKMDESKVLDETVRRYEIMRRASECGLGENLPSMHLLQPTARKIFQAETQNLLVFGGLHTRAAARAMAVMHVNSGGGVICAAPTAGSAGTLPGTVLTLAEKLLLNDEKVALALLAAAAVGVIIAIRATFAAEEGGCQMEIGAAGAMAAAAAVEAAGGNAIQATDAASIAFQNTMGTICDPVQGFVEIPCHTRNAVAASSAFVCADLTLGGYHNPIPLDESIDAAYAVGKMLPCELKCTALGGLSLAPSALAMRST